MQRVPLQRFRVEDILLIGSPYDHFSLAANGLLRRDPYGNPDLFMSQPPRIHHVRDLAQARQLVSRQAVQAVWFCGDPHAPAMHEFRRHLAEIDPCIQVIALVSRAAYRPSPANDPPPVDRLFIWNGNLDLPAALVYLTEDCLNIQRGSESATLRLILLVESDPHFYSFLLPELLGEVLSKVRSLSNHHTEESTRVSSRVMLHLACDYEDAVALASPWAHHLLGIITDLRLTTRGEPDPGAGINLLRLARSLDPKVPAIIYSDDPSKADAIGLAGGYYLPKESPAFLRGMQGVLMDYFGFGDFIFRTPDDREITRATTVDELIRLMGEVPLESFLYHGRNDHFSGWLYVHGEWELADFIKPMSAENEAQRREIQRLIGEWWEG